MDSIVLLHYLHQHYPTQLRAIHCNHHLSNYADQWQQFCQTTCQQLGVGLTSVDLALDGSSNLEQQARDARYHAINCQLQEGEVLCTAHHQNDQAETLLLQLFRGAGSAGLAAMPKAKPLGKGVHYRPMLSLSKAAIEAYAKQHKLQWIEDDSNKNVHFRRNYLRLEILPKLDNLYQNLVESLARSAKHQAEALQLNQDLAKLDIEQNDLLSQAGRLRVSALNSLADYRLKNVIRYQLTQLDFSLPSDKVMMQMLQLLRAKEDASPLVSWGAFEVRRFQDELYFINTQHDNAPVDCALFDEFKHQEGFSIAYRQAGQRVRLPGKSHSQSLKKLLQEAGIPPWERNTLRMYYIDDELRAMEKLGYLSED